MWWVEFLCFVVVMPFHEVYVAVWWEGVARFLEWSLIKLFAYIFKALKHSQFLFTSKLAPFRLCNPTLYSCFTTEILEGFDVQRTTGLGDTLKKYGYLTQAISQYYKTEILVDNVKCSGTCPPFGEFIKRCQDLEKTTVSDVFAIQLMQVLAIWKFNLNCFSIDCLVCLTKLNPLTLSTSLICK